ncbi:MAG: hypothetical protein HY743_01845 [Deltaproteobacteria bacterium]|nr:hypothetical protein [Deltaproteobacteria bacterium]
MSKKAWWRSKTLWVNLIAGGAFYLQSRYGFAIDPELQAGLLGTVNIILRMVTKEAVGLQDEKLPTGPGPFPGIDAGGPGVGGS